QLTSELEDLRQQLLQYQHRPVEFAQAGETLLSLERAVQQSVDGICVADMDGVVRFANPAWLRMHGYAEHGLPAVVDQHIRIFHTDEQYAGDVVPFLERLKHADAHEGEVGHVCKDGRSFPAWMTASVLKDEQDTPLGFVGIARDITESKRAEQALRESEQRYQDLYDNAPDMYFTVSEDGTVLSANASGAKHLGYTREELIGGPVWVVVHPDDEPRIRQQVEGIFKGEGETEELRFRKVRKDGSVLWVHERVRVIPGREGSPRALQIVCRDITDHKQAEEALRASEERYRDLVEHSHGLIAIHDLDGTILATNPEAARSLGHEPPFGVGLNLVDILAPDVRSELPAYLQRIRQEGWDEGVMRVVTKSGEQRIWAYRNVLRQEGEREPYVLAIALDITDLKRAEQSARQSELRYRTLVDHATYGIYRSSADGRFLAANPAMAKMLGYESADELLALDLARDVYVDPTERARLVEEYKDTDAVDELEVEWKRKDGEQVIVRLSGRVLRDPAGEFDGFEMIADDVTERRALEEQIRQAQKMEAIGQLTGGIAHDFNNILTIILANADLVGAALPSDQKDAEHDLKELRAAARRGTAMVKMLLGFGRRELLSVKPVDIGQLVARLSVSLRRLLPEDIDVRVFCESPRLHAQADPGTIEQILVNLATNARDAMPDGGLLRIEVRRAWLDDDHVAQHGWGEPGEYVCVAVSDTGMGMDDRTRRKIFEPFFTTKEPGVGTGLGMAMIYGLVRQQRGFVDVQSEPGEGTTVKVYLVRVHEPERAAAATATEEALHQGTETVLVVEDEEPIRRVAQRTLERFGYRVLLAADGEEGLNTFISNKADIDLVITDLVMPKMSGPDLYTAISSESPAPKFVFTSGYGARDIRAGATLDATVPFLPKPWTLTELLVRVREALDGEL
ncbi:MAG: PAS domain S-box protein, partial [Gemmatimonadales bacterium]|nr:PAS domain S-box protein [Gemmatimonadales bacterium]NIN12838.1 PAS domain S-box protein [Gemmatimonadales bacterium]NIN48766.1 PAS domain S-box protein [Gemmatimonadales bacterium]NIP06230.1 PAS domain S-box protein [Gemmatimonadales bacterium]NIR01415.1 PAS domain S-box protein [Gemmatimonadales bacterium]